MRGGVRKCSVSSVLCAVKLVGGKSEAEEVGNEIQWHGYRGRLSIGVVSVLLALGMPMEAGFSGTCFGVGYKGFCGW